jgi:hypothetical protein
MYGMQRAPRQQEARRKGSWRIFLGIGAISVMSLCTSAVATPALASDYSGALSVSWDNDETMGSDNNYTHGGFISWATNEVNSYDSDGFVRKWADFWSFLPHVGERGSETYAAWTLGLEAFTPDRYRNPDPPLDDQPYAGTLYVDSTLRTWFGRSASTWTLRLGMVGPSAHAEQIQNGFHKLVGVAGAEGWDTQLSDEPILNVGYTRDYLWLEGEFDGPMSWRLVPTVDAALGTYLTGLGGGIFGEIGWNLPAKFGGRRLFQGFEPALSMGVGPQNNLSVALYGGLGGYGIAYFLPLDGNVFHDSRSVDSNSALGVLTAGVSLRYKRFAARTGVTYYTETFATERERVDFASFELVWYF